MGVVKFRVIVSIQQVIPAVLDLLLSCGYYTLGSLLHQVIQDILELFGNYLESLVVVVLL